MHLNGQTFSSVLDSFKVFLVKSAKIDFFNEKMVLRVVFIKLTFRWLQTGLSDLKNTKIIEILLMVDFLRIFEILHFSKFFEIF